MPGLVFQVFMALIALFPLLGLTKICALVSHTLFLSITASKNSPGSVFDRGWILSGVYSIPTCVSFG